ncbi:helix-turn-helix transcriptional regulator [Fusobacterium varium]|uniref:helix-turn-helix domain-containing protein n=1 Tax=Fusobacterium varium TaxID=856 RepID=UPI0027DB3722|nr:helix-turn-helix transcriptional regulator [uncultured Fusobacterium sp.]
MNIKEYEELICEKNFEISQSRRKELGEYIKALREEKKISLTQLADLTKINVSDLHKIEHGTKNKVNPFQLKAISNVLQVDYKIFYRMANFLENKDFNSNGHLENEKNYSKEDLISILSMYYPKVNVELLFEKLSGIATRQMNEIFLFIDFVKEKK